MTTSKQTTLCPPHWSVHISGQIIGPKEEMLLVWNPVILHNKNLEHQTVFAITYYDPTLCPENID